jgi:hypothetical protein
VGDIGAVQRFEHPELAQHRLVPPPRHDAGRTPEHRFEVTPGDLEDLVRRTTADEA